MAKQAKYESNPFPLTFSALGKLFEHNLVWALVLIGITVFGTILQLIGRLIGAIATEPQTTSSISQTSSASTSSSEVGLFVVLALLGLLFFAIFIAVSAAISTYVAGLYSYVALKSVDGKQVDAGEAFRHVNKRFWVFFGAQILAYLKIIGWFFVFIIPGIVATYRYALLPYVAVGEEGSSVKDIHDRTKLLTKKRLWEVFGVQFIANIVPFIGNLVGYSGRAALYRQMQVSTDTKTEKPKIHWLNYIGIMLAGAIIVFVLLIVLLLLLVSLANR